MPAPEDQRDRVLGAVERRRLKAEHRDLFMDLAAFFFEVDPVGINFGINAYEYEPEVGTILPRVLDTHSVAEVAQIVEEEFERWFGESICMERASYEDIAEGIVEILIRYRAER